MRLLIALVFSLFVSSIQAQVDYTHKTNADLTVTVRNIDKFKGVIMIALYDSDSSWLQKGKEYRGAMVEVTATTLTYVFKDLPFGTYALLIYHDKNSDGELNKNWLGLPNEGYCFSNNYKPLAGAPKYKEAVFKFSKQMKLYLDMHY